MKMNRDLELFFQDSDDFGNIKGSHYSSHIFEAEGICSHILDLFGFFAIIVQVEYIAAHAPLGQ